MRYQFLFQKFFFRDKIKKLKEMIFFISILNKCKNLMNLTIFALTSSFLVSHSPVFVNNKIALFNSNLNRFSSIFFLIKKNFIFKILYSSEVWMLFYIIKKIQTNSKYYKIKFSKKSLYSIMIQKNQFH